MKFSPCIKYKINGQTIEINSFSSNDLTVDFKCNDNEITATLKPNREIELLEFSVETDYTYEEKELFFVNGYQSWTTSAEMGRYDTMKGMFNIANISYFTKNLAGISGDYNFVNYSNKMGELHSFTYTYFKYKKRFTLFGSLSEDKGFTIFYADYINNKFKISKDVEGFVLSSEVKLLDVVIESGTYDEAFDNYFAKMNLPELKIDHMSGYTSWYNYFQNINEEIILRDLKGMDRVKNQTTIFQIDDGFESYVGDWLTVDNKKFPNGMKYIADKIHKKGYLAGIWLAPLSCQIKSKVYKEHPDWVVIDNNTGKPHISCAGWGGAYTLDIYKEEVREYIKNFFDVILNEWGYDMVKLDFLYSQCMQPRNGKSRGELMHDAMVFLRECVGEKLILGCGVPLGSAFGYVDACRISCDVDLKYTGKYYNKMHINNEIPSAQFAINNTIFRRHLDGRAFCNDPDVFFLRDDNLTFDTEQKLLLAKINNLFGNVLFVSDDVSKYNEIKLGYIRDFFKKSNAKIISAKYTDKDNITIRFEEDKQLKELQFNIKTGVNNIRHVL